MKLKVLPICLLACLLAVNTGATEPPEIRDLEIFGWVERVKLMNGALSMKAKLDTGAATSSLDATHIERFRRGGKRWVRFVLTDPETDETVEVEKPLVRMVQIVRHSGNYQRRPVVEMDICLGYHRRTVEVNLIDRTHFIYPMLLGRSALEGIALIDAGNSHLNSPRCEFEGSDE